MKLALFVHSLKAGGAERVISILASQWAEQGYEVTIFTFAPAEPFYELHENVSVQCLNLNQESHTSWQGIKNTCVRVFKIRKYLKKIQPDTLIAFTSTVNILTLLASRGLGIRVVISERIHINYLPIGRLWSKLRQWVYPWADAIVVQTQSIKHACPASWQEKVQVIPNPVLEPAVTTHIPDLQKPCFIAVGRLDPQKGFDFLIDTFKRFHQQFSDWHLYIMGEGKDRALLESRIAPGIAGFIHLPGTVSPVYDWLKQADGFILSSRFEGFPNALCEAMATGLPVISTDCPSGPGEIIDNGSNGLLIPVDDQTALLKAMTQLASNPELRGQLANNAKQITQTYSVERIMAEWSNII